MANTPPIAWYLLFGYFGDWFIPGYHQILYDRSAVKHFATYNLLLKESDLTVNGS